MASTAYEITGSFGNIVSDDDVIFPNVLSCVAVACRIGGGIVGVHITLADRGHLSAVAEHVIGRYGRPSEVYVLGPVMGAYNVNGFANFGCPIRVFDTPGGIDVRAQMQSGAFSMAKRTTGGAWTDVPLTSFIG